MAAKFVLAEQRVGDLHDGLVVVGLRLTERLKRLERELAAVRVDLDGVCEAIYNATVYDPSGERLEVAS